MSTQVPEERKQAMTKTFAIVGFIAIILIAVWLAVKIVSVLPSAFSSLASLADSVYNHQPNTELVVTTPKSVVNTGEAFTITWSDKGGGTYNFQYECAEGVAIDIRKGTVRESISCDTPVDLGDRTSLELFVSSEKKRFMDVHYTITHSAAGTETVSKKSLVTVLNATIPTSVVLGDSTDTDEDEDTDEEVVTPSTPTTPSQPSTPTTPSVPATPQYTQEYIYAIPTSDPKGTTDLSVRLIGVGIMTSAKQFLATPIIGKGQTGAIQFEVKNIGTKTSEEWTFKADLPADIDYTSSDQKELKPNERAVITLGFDGVTKTGAEVIKVSITTDEDTTKTNNTVTGTVTIR